MADEIQPLEGKTTIDDKMFFGPERLSYRTAALLADRIVHKIKTNLVGKTVVVLPAPVVADFANLEGIRLVLANLTGDYLSLADMGTALAARRTGGVNAAAAGNVAADAANAAFLTPITAGISSVLGLISLFREDTEYRGVRTVVDPLAFELALAAALLALGTRRPAAVIVPDLSMLSGQATKDSLREALFQVHQAKAKSWAAVGPLVSVLVRLEARLDRAIIRKDQPAVDSLTAQINQLRRDLDPVTNMLSDADNRLNDLENELGKADPNTGLTALARLLRAEAIRAAHPEGTFLHAKIVSSGGHHKIVRSLWRFVFFGDGLSFSGGAVVRWAILQKDGAVLEAGLEDSRLDDRW